MSRGEDEPLMMPCEAIDTQLLQQSCFNGILGTAHLCEISSEQVKAARTREGIEKSLRRLACSIDRRWSLEGQVGCADN